MDEWLGSVLAGVDPAQPDAAWQIFVNLMALVPWRFFALLTLASVIGAVLIARRRRGSLGWAVLWALLLGPVGWVPAWHDVRPGGRCRACGARMRARERSCRACGAPRGGSR